jgi:hypothetical protein
MAIDPGRIRPIGLDRDDVEPMRLDQAPGDRGPRAIELRGAVRRFAEQHHLRIADPVEQCRERRRIDRRQRFGMADNGRRRFVRQPVPATGRARSAIRTQRWCFRIGRPPGLLADQRHEGDGTQILADEPAIGAAKAQQSLAPIQLADRDDETPAGRQLRQQGGRDIGAAGGNEYRIEGRLLWPAQRAVANSQVDIVAAGQGQ